MFKKGLVYVILFNEIHHDEHQWIEPSVYNPERFNLNTPDNKWARTADGKPRNTLAFTPFLGGKRICLGKTFAEVTVKYTLPMIYHHVDFEFAEPETQRVSK